MSDLKKLYSMNHSMNAEVASATRLSFMISFIEGNRDLTPGLILYFLDPIFCMDVGDLDELLNFIEYQFNNSMIQEKEYQFAKKYIGLNQLAIFQSFKFLEWFLLYLPSTQQAEIQNELKDKLFELFGKFDTDVAEDIAQEYYRSLCLWKRFNN